MNRRLLIIGGIGAIIVLVAVVALFIIERSPALQNAVYKISNTNSPTTTTVTNTTVANTNTANPQLADRIAIQYAARNFAEVYGSSSSQNNFANLEEAKKWGTVNFNKFIDTQIAQGRAQPASAQFQQTISTALVITITKLGTTAASVTVTMQRQETINTAARTYTQDLFVDLVKQGTDWKINAAVWQKL